MKSFLIYREQILGIEKGLLLLYTNEICLENWLWHTKIHIGNMTAKVVCIKYLEKECMKFR